jgi:RNA-directed DNA polymerase
MPQRMAELKQVIIGWVNYFGISDMKRLAKLLDSWLRRKIRMCFWKQWKKIKTKHDNLVALGVPNHKAWEYANTRKSYWRVAGSPILAGTLTNEYLKKVGFQSISERHSSIH